MYHLIKLLIHYNKWCTNVRGYGEARTVVFNKVTINIGFNAKVCKKISTNGNIYEPVFYADKLDCRMWFITGCLSFHEPYQELYA